jgi:hypothetical protein
MPGVENFYLIKGIWTNFDGTTETSVGTHGYPSLEHVNHAIKQFNNEFPNIKHVHMKAPANTPLLDINWENHLEFK